MTTDLHHLLAEAVDQHVFPGASAAIFRHNQSFFATSGSLRGDGKTAVTPETLYDVASVTKAIPTATLARKLVEAGVIALDQTMGDLLPEYQGEGRDQITLRDLLDFRVRWKLTLSSLKHLPPKTLWNHVLHASLAEPVPSTSRWCVNATSLLLGRIVETWSGQTLSSLAQQSIFGPLSMTHTTFSPLVPGEGRTDSLAPSEIDSWRGREICGEVHDESAWLLRQLFVPGSAGLFSTAPDLLKFLQWQLQHWSSQPEPHTHSSIEEVGLGWEVQESWMSSVATKTTCGKTGFTGCLVMWDPSQAVAGVVLSNATYPHRPTSRKSLHFFRQQFCYLALTGSLPPDGR